jgi:hypothetical protein
MRSKRIEEIFEECLERVFDGESIEECVSRYPEQAKELRELLETAVATRKAVAVEPRPEFRARARQQLQNALRERETLQQRRWHFKWNWQPRWAVGLTAFLVLIISGSGAVLASNNSMPGQALYAVKLAAEQVRLAVATSPEAKAEVYVGLAERRVDEIVYLANNGNAIQVEQATGELDNCLTNISNLSGGVAQKTALTARNDNGDSTYGATGGTEAAPATPSLVAPAATPTPAPPVTVSQTPGGESQYSDDTKASTATVEVINSRNGTYTITVSDGGDVLLRAKIYYQSVEFPALLKQALQNARPEVRQALLQAIAVSQSGYEKALQSLQ